MADNGNTELLTVAEAAAVLRLKPTSVRSWILAKRIPYVKLGSRVFLRRSDCEALIAACVVPARAGRNAICGGGEVTAELSATARFLDAGAFDPTTEPERK